MAVFGGLSLIPRETSAQEVAHPVEAYLVRPVQPTLAVSLDHPVAVSGLQPFVESLRTVTQVLEIGALEGSPQEVFGLIRDATIGTDGTLFVLDARYNEVRVFDSTGAFVASVGRPGRGPGEFVRPLSVALDSAQRLLVGDITRQVHLFRPSDDRSEFVFEKSFRLSAAPEDMCAFRDRVVVHGTNPDQQYLLHILDTDKGTTRLSFGAVYRSGNSLVNHQLSLGKIACVPAHGLIVYAPTSVLPEVRAYDLEGEPVWLTTIEGYRSISVSEPSPGRMSVVVPQGGFHRIEAVTYDPHGFVILQIAFVTREDHETGSDFSELHTLVLKPESGRGTYGGHDWGPIMASFRPWQLQVWRDPFPLVRLYRFSDTKE